MEVNENLEGNDTVGKILDGYGLLFDPIKHAAWTTAALQRHWREQERLRLNPEVPIEPEWKEKPAGHRMSGSGV